MRVLLINPKLSSSLGVWIPLGMASIAAYIRKFGLKVKIIDHNFIELDKAKLETILKNFRPDIVGIGGLSVQRNDAIDLGQLIKSIDKKLLLVYGGPHFTFVPEDGLKFGDICVIGEGEETFLEICKNSDYSQIKGIAYKKENKIVFTEERPFIQNLDEIPFPAYDLLNMNNYSDHLITRQKAMSIMTGRGCPYNCVFCASPKLWKRTVRYHSLDHIKVHIKFLIQKYGLQNLRIMDDTFTLSKKRVLDFCDMIEAEGFKLNMTCLTNVKNANYEVFKRMKEVGFSIVAFGIESGNDEILKKINKGITVEDAKHGVKLAKDAGLKTELLFMIGNIGENKQTILDSIRLAKDINPIGSNKEKFYEFTSFNVFQFATPNPGSKFNEIASEYGEVVETNLDKYYHAVPTFIPKGLDSETMIKLRTKAFNETLRQAPSWLSILVSKSKKNAILKRLLNKVFKKVSI